MAINWNNIEEPIRSVANKVVAFVISLSAILVVLNQATTFLPANYRDKVSVVLGAVGAVFAVVIKIGGEIGRAKVSPVVKTDAILQAEVAAAQAAALRKP